MRESINMCFILKLPRSYSCNRGAILNLRFLKKLFFERLILKKLVVKKLLG